MTDFIWIITDKVNTVIYGIGYAVKDEIWPRLKIAFFYNKSVVFLLLIKVSISGM